MECRRVIDRARTARRARQRRLAGAANR
jgi:hypothetical protein